MKYFKNELDKVFGFDDDFDGVPEELISITETEMITLTKVVLTTEQIRSNAIATGEVYPLNGTDYQVPFTKDDGDAIMQVNSGFQMGLLETNIHFSNDTVMPIKATEFQEFAVWFVNKRNSFFI